MRQGLVALLALFAWLARGLTTPAKAFRGFADPAVLAVLAVAAVRVVSRAASLAA